MNNITHIVPVLDTSGSMGGLTYHVTNALEVFIHEQRKLSMLTKMTCFGFDNMLHGLGEGFPRNQYLHRIERLPQGYNTPGGTNIPTSILNLLGVPSCMDHELGVRTKAAAEAIRNGGPAVVMLFTDGAGRDGWEKQSKQAMAEWRRRGWLFLFCMMDSYSHYAGGDATSDGSAYGTPYGFLPEHCMATPLNGPGLRKAMTDFSERVIKFRNEAALKVAA